MVRVVFDRRWTVLKAGNSHGRRSGEDLQQYVVLLQRVSGAVIVCKEERQGILLLE